MLGLLVCMTSFYMGDGELNSSPHDCKKHSYLPSYLHSYWRHCVVQLSIQIWQVTDSECVNTFSSMGLSSTILCCCVKMGYSAMAYALVSSISDHTVKSAALRLFFTCLWNGFPVALSDSVIEGHAALCYHWCSYCSGFSWGLGCSSSTYKTIFSHLKL